MAPDTTPKDWPAEPRGLLDDAPRFIRAALRALLAAISRKHGGPGIPLEASASQANSLSRADAVPLREERPVVPGLKLRTDLTALGENLNERLLRDIGLGDGLGPSPGDGTPENVRLRETGAAANAKQEDIMARDNTPSDWPPDARGILDDLGGAASKAGLFKQFGQLLETFRSFSPRGPHGQMSATLEKGQCLALDGSRPATVECLAGAAWITCPSEGKDVQLRAGQAARIEEPGNVVVAALGGPARIRMGWR